MSSSIEIKHLLDKLCGSSKLERDRAEISLNDSLKDSTEYAVIINWIDGKLMEKKHMECCLGCLTAFKLLLGHCTSLSTDYLYKLANECITFLQHEEYRVRILAGECLGELCRLLGVIHITNYITIIKQGIKSNIVHSKKTIPKSNSKVHEENVSHENKEWKFLETWIKCLQCVINSLDKHFKEVFDQEMLTIIFEASDHINRFVRESCYDLIGTVAEKEGFVNQKFFYLLACEQLGKGLSDNWSQVRMPASTAVRKLLQSPRSSELTEEEVFKHILPKICLNRYYAAEGVRLYNQETWRLVVGSRGKEIIEGNIKETVYYYCDQSTAANHDSREAACSSILELMNKIDPDIVKPYINMLLRALEVSLSDDVWSVRDVACMACGRLVALFPEETSEYRKDAMMPLFLSIVLDSMSPLRESGAYSVAAAVNAFSALQVDLLKDVLTFIYDNLEKVKNQTQVSDRIITITKKSPPNSNVDVNHENCKLSSSDDESLDRETNGGSQQVCKVGSIAYESSLWERADGCIFLIGELSVQVPQSHEHMPELFAAIVKAVSYRHYSQHVYLLATVAANLTKLCDGIGKTHFKRYLSEVLDIIDVCLASDCAIAVASAEQAVRGLSTRLGNSILQGRIEMHSRYLQDRTKHLFT